MRNLESLAYAAGAVAMAGCLAMAYTVKAQGPVAPVALPGSFALVLLVNRPDGSQTETPLMVGMPAEACLPAMAAIWRANGDLPAVGADELGPIPAFDAYCRTD